MVGGRSEEPGAQSCGREKSLSLKIQLQESELGWAWGRQACSILPALLPDLAPPGEQEWEQGRVGEQQRGPSQGPVQGTPGGPWVYLVEVEVPIQLEALPAWAGSTPGSRTEPRPHNTCGSLAVWPELDRFSSEKRWDHSSPPCPTPPLTEAEREWAMAELNLSGPLAPSP